MTNVQNDGTLGPKLTSPSKVAVYRLWAYIVSYAIWLHENIVETNAKNSRTYVEQWYHAESLNYIDGVPLVWNGSFFDYDTTGLTPEEIEARKVIKRCAVKKLAQGVGQIKVATVDNAGNSVPLPPAVLSRFSNVMMQKAPVGTKLEFVNREADDLKIYLKVWVDDLIIDKTTGRILTTDEEIYPVKEVMREYLANLSFDGRFVKTFCTDKIQQATGVVIPKITSAQHKYGGYNWASFDEFVTADAGHFRLSDENFIISYQSTSGSERFSIIN